MIRLTLYLTQSVNSTNEAIRVTTLLQNVFWCTALPVDHNYYLFAPEIRNAFPLRFQSNVDDKQQNESFRSNSQPHTRRSVNQSHAHLSVIYLGRECNDIIVCRVWRYGRSWMIRKSPKTRPELLLHACAFIDGRWRSEGGRAARWSFLCEKTILGKYVTCKLCWLIFTNYKFKDF